MHYINTFHLLVLMIFSSCGDDSIIEQPSFSYKIYGTVNTYLDGEFTPIPDVIVRYDSTEGSSSQFTQTDAFGYYQFSCKSNYSISWITVMEEWGNWKHVGDHYTHMDKLNIDFENNILLLNEKIELDSDFTKDTLKVGEIINISWRDISPFTYIIYINATTSPTPSPDLFLTSTPTNHVQFKVPDVGQRGEYELIIAAKASTLTKRDANGEIIGPGTFQFERHEIYYQD